MYCVYSTSLTPLSPNFVRSLLLQQALLLPQALLLQQALLLHGNAAVHETKSIAMGLV